MTFSFYSPPKLSATEAGGYPDLIGSLLSGYQDVYKARQEPERLKKIQLENKWYEPNIQSEIGLRGAHGGLLGEQTRAAHMTNEYLPDKLKSQMESMRLKYMQDKMFNELLQRRLSGNQDQIGMGSPQYNPGQGGAPFAQSQQPSFLEQPSPEMTNFSQPLSIQDAYIRASRQQPTADDLLNKKLFGVDTFSPRNKSYLDLLTKPISARQEELSKIDARKIGKLEDVVLNSTSKLDTFNQLNEILGSPQFESMRQNPILGRHELGWYSKFGTREQQDMVGQSQAYMGNIIKDSARDFAGQFRIGEQALLNSMKPNSGDSLDTMKGKAEALTFLTTMMSRRAELQADFQRNYGMSPLAAKIAADKEINPGEIKKQIHTILHPASSKNMISIRNKKTGEKITVTREEARKRGLNV